jgi:DNA-binding CsgD family transcriptional regulator
MPLHNPGGLCLSFLFALRKIRPFNQRLVDESWLDHQNMPVSSELMVGISLPRLEFGLFERANSRLGEAVLDPSQWPSIMEDICVAVGTTGAVLLQSDARTPDVPMTPSVVSLLKDYFHNNLHTSDIRAAKGMPLLLSGRSAVRDQDMFRSETEMLRDPLYAILTRHKFRWFAGISFQSGQAMWVMTLQRSIAEGMYDDDEIKILAALSEPLTEAATLSRAVGRQVLLGSLNAFELINEPALSISSTGLVVEMNRAASNLFDAEFRVRNNRLYMRDGKASQALERMLWDRPRDGEIRPRSQGRVGNIIVARREHKRPILIRALPVHGAASTPFLGARAILVLRDLEAERRAPLDILSEAFSLTMAEAKVASMVAAGSSSEEIASELQVSRETVRNQIKAIFGKTGTHRQSELAALVSRVRG